MAVRDEMEQQVRDALVHLHDVVYLQTHPLARLAATEPYAGGRREAGQALRERLLATIRALRPAGNDGPPEARRGHLVLELRYIEGLDPVTAGTRLGLGKSQFYREHERALSAVTSLVTETWAPNAVGIGQPNRGALSKPRAAPAPVPRSSTTFIGRERELATLVEELAAAQRGQRSHLLTLGGPPGVGKTRLAIEGARTVAERGMYERIYYVDLSVLELGAAPQVLSLIEHGVGASQELGDTVLSRLEKYFADSSVLLVLDNFEQVVDAAGDLGQLLDRCPNMQVLVTSRRPLGLYGEREMPLAPLATPPPALAFSEGVGEYAAVKLFVERASGADPAFRLTPANAASVSAICRRLDGLPLAIELATARLKILPPQALLQRLEDRLAVLNRGSRDAASRHQTLRAAIDWSYRLLEPDEQVVLRELAVFAGSFSLGAAEAVVNRMPRPTFDILQSLIEQGLLFMESDEPRFRLLGTIREYAAEKLAQSGQDKSLRDRHMEYYVAAGDRRFTRITRLAIEDDDNLRDALQAVLQETLALGRQQADRRQVALALAGLASLAHAQGDLGQALAHNAESGRLFRELADPRGEALADLRSGQIAAQAGQLPQAELQLQSAISCLTRISADGPAAEGSVDLAWLTVDRGDVEAARRHVRHALELALRSGNIGAAIGATEAAAAVAWSVAQPAVAEHLVGIAAAARSRAGLPAGPGRNADVERRAVDGRLRSVYPALMSIGRQPLELLVREAQNAMVGLGCAPRPE